jgi:adenine-specific DNA-methyltransferase
MENNYDRFKSTLKTIFQIDRADLDFGIYRILNQKHDEITAFLDNDLLPQVKQELVAYEAGDQTEIQAELDKMTAKLKELGVNEDQIATNDKVVELTTQLQTAGNVAELESEVFSHLLRFFERYYEEGDFISKRRYKDGVYAIPYEGEEVKLHWANHDQYYIKTSERFKDFSFKVSDQSVHFRIKEAETDTGNNKNISGKDRRFVLCAENFWSEENNELNLYFQYVSVDGKMKQEECSAGAITAVLEAVPAKWRDLLAALAPTEKQKDRTVLAKFLTSYTATNTFDYFIHNDLSTFLTRELDFYIKNEVMFLDDIENESAPRADQYLAKLKVIRVVAKKIIKMLAQLEDFQKKLWEKKKFVVGTGYCITLDLVPEQYYDAILSSDAQLAEWKQLGFIDDKTELDHEYLQAHPTLSIDTKFFSEWKDELLATFDNLDEQVNGVMINSENFGALNVLQERYKEEIKTIYIDPPYNTNASEIVYKNGYRHSSWLSLMENRIKSSLTLMSKTGLLQVAIDDEEQRFLHSVLDLVLGQDNFVSNVSIQHNPRGRSDAKHIAPAHEYLLFYAKDILNLATNQLTQSLVELKEKYPKTDSISMYRELPLKRSGSNSKRTERPNLFYPIYYSEVEDRLTLQSLNNTDVEILPVDQEGVERCWRWGKDKVQKSINTELIVKKTPSGYTIVAKDRMKETIKPKSFWYGPRHDASSHGTMLLKNMFTENTFSYPKSINTVRDAVSISSMSDSLVLDYFAGSGTTSHAVLKLNREDNEKKSGSGLRKYILVEMGEYFNTVTKPRIQKVVYSDEWSAGKPQDDGATGTNKHIIKYFKLESYEDTLNNLELKKTAEQLTTLNENKSLREDYTLGYMLDVETKDSVLSLDSFQNPFTYNIKLATDVVGETKETPVDLVETFNYLIGMKVATMRKHGEHLLVIDGVTRAGEKTLIIWRNKKVVDNAGLDDFFGKQALNTTDFEYQRIYVNGDNNLENLKADGDQWKVVTIEEEFHKRMFA